MLKTAQVVVQRNTTDKSTDNDAFLFKDIITITKPSHKSVLIFVHLAVPVQTVMVALKDIF